jgi:hypothetical protein
MLIKVNLILFFAFSTYMELHKIRKYTEGELDSNWPTNNNNTNINHWYEEYHEILLHFIYNDERWRAVPWKLKVPTQFQILKREHHSKALRKSEQMYPARFSRPKSTFHFLYQQYCYQLYYSQLDLHVLLLLFCRNKKIPLWSLF